MRTIKYFIANLITHPLIGNIIAWVYKNKIPYNSVTINTASSFIKPKIKASIFWKLYEGREVKFVNNDLTPDYDVVELGSSIGVVACQIGKKINSDKRLICIEANPELIPIIEGNLAYNNIKNFKVLNLAVANRPEEEFADFSFGDNNTVGKVNMKSDSNSIKIKASPLSKILKENNIQEFSLVCDIEGGELGILLNDLKSLENCKQIIIETHSTNYNNKMFHSEDMIKILENIGFKITKSHWPNYVLVKQ